MFIQLHPRLDKPHGSSQTILAGRQTKTSYRFTVFPYSLKSRTFAVTIYGKMYVCKLVSFSSQGETALYRRSIGISMMTVHQKSITFSVLIDLKRLGNSFFPFWFDIGMVLLSCLEIDMVCLFD